jgi:2-dehydro-3-deoxyphosphogluconate aldolase/(4S)-4-hydroxy-2-oxoglutarate aldolase
MGKPLSMTSILQQAAPVMPVVTINQVDHAIPLASALLAAGISVLEVTLRNDCALEVIRRMKTVPGLIVGAGTVIHPQQFQQLKAVNADFAVSPGTTPQLLAAANHSDLAFLPAIATTSDIMRAMAEGYQQFKFFPAAASGGINALTAFAGPFPSIQFCPTGGITADNFRRYLALENVSCVGGSWLTPAQAIEQQDWQRIEQLARSLNHRSH